MKITIRTLTSGLLGEQKVAIYDISKTKELFYLGLVEDIPPILEQQVVSDIYKRDKRGWLEIAIHFKREGN